MTKMLYVLGAAIIVIGIIILVGQIWDDLGALGRIVITFGLGMLFAVLGSVLLKQKPNEKLGAVFHAIGGMLIPGGTLVLLSELNVETVSLWPVAISFGVIFIFYLLLNSVFRNAILTFFAIANGTAFTYLLVESIIDGKFYENRDVHAYLTMAIGISYLLLARVFKAGKNKRLVGFLYFFGIAGFLSAAFSRVFDSELWQFAYFFIIFAAMFLSVYLKSRSILAISTLFLIAHITYITNEYFADSLGWPLSLVLLGFIFIGLGYASVSINKKYIKTPA